MPEVVINETAETETPFKTQLREMEEMDISTYLKNLAADTPIRVTVKRISPSRWRGKNIKGTIETFDEPITEEQIRDLYGGGKYTLVIKAPDSRGSYVIKTNKTIEIAGDPRTDGLAGDDTDDDHPAAVSEHPSAVREAMNMAARMAEHAEKRAERELHRPQGADPALQMVMAELRAARTDAAAKDAMLLELATKKESNATEMLLGKAIDGESTRIQAIQLRLDSELRMRAEMHKAEIDRLHQRYEDIARRQEDSHKREVDNLSQSNANQLAMLKVSYDGQIEGYKREITHFSGQLTVAQAEVVALREKKDKPLLESLTEMAAMKDAIESFSGSNKEEGSTLERIVGNVMSSPLLEGIATRVAGGAPPEAHQAQAPEEAEIPFNRPVQLPDGRVIVRKTDGTVIQIKRKPAGPNPTGGAAAVSNDDIRVAVQFMESALAGDADPKEFVRTARSLVPSLSSGPIQELLRTQGVDAFLARVAKLQPNSSLLQQHGKNWTRKVAAALLE